GLVVGCNKPMLQRTGTESMQYRDVENTGFYADDESDTYAESNPDAHSYSYSYSYTHANTESRWHALVRHTSAQSGDRLVEGRRCRRDTQRQLGKLCHNAVQCGEWWNGDRGQPSSSYRLGSQQHGNTNSRWKFHYVYVPGYEVER